MVVDLRIGIYTTHSKLITLNPIFHSRKAFNLSSPFGTISKQNQTAMSKLITVFGATGVQGGSVIRAILNDPALSKEFKIRGITRDTSKPAAKELEAQGVELVSVCLATLLPSSHTD